ncbi:unnamed protein product [Ophioblennius macclurei]
MGFRELLLGLCVYLQINVSLGDDLSCSVSLTAEGTRYDVPQIAGELDDYYWKNAAGQTLAFRDGQQENKMEQVVDHDQTSLLLRDCDKVILFTTTDSQGVLHTATCSATCSEKQPEPAGTGNKADASKPQSIPRPPSGASDDGSHTSEQQPGPKGHTGIYVGLGIGLPLLVAVVVVVVVCRKRLQNYLHQYG